MQTLLIDQLEEKVNAFMNQPLVHPKCVINSWFKSAIMYKNDMATDQSERNKLLSTKHFQQFTNLVAVEIPHFQSEYDWLIENLPAIEQAILDGEMYTKLDWGNGWQWEYKAVKVNGKEVQLTYGGYCIYNGQNGKPVIKAS